MAYQTEQKVKNLAQQLAGMPEQHNQTPYSSQVFMGRVAAVNASNLKVERLKESSVAQDGTITWPTGAITNAHIDYVQVYGVPTGKVLSDLYVVGDPVQYQAFDGTADNREKIRGTMVTIYKAGGAGAIGTYQGQAHVMVVDNQDGWDFIRGHA